MKLKHNPSEAMRQLLIDHGVASDGTTGYSDVNGTVRYTGSEWPCFSTNEVDTPDETITVYDTQGTDDGRSHVDGIQEYHPGIQVRVRALGAISGRQKAEDVRHFLEQLYQNVVHVDAAVYTVWNAAKIGNCISVGTEAGKSKRVIYTVNCTLAITQVSPTPVEGYASPSVTPPAPQPL